MIDSLGLIGKTFGKCTIERPLAKGGYGYSYIGYDSELDKKRVVKISKVSLGLDEMQDYDLENFKREGVILARLKHPQIVTMMEQGEKYGFRYMIIDYINGFDLTYVLDALQRKRNEVGCKWSDIMDPATALGIALSSLKPLSYAHKVKISLPGEGVVKGLAHRDISAGNLILGFDHEFEGMMYLIDFGIAKTNINISTTINTGVVGNIKYMSPMRIMRKESKVKEAKYWQRFQQTQHDVHSMGCLLWELLTGNTHIGINDEDLVQCLAAIQNPKTYTDLYDQAKIYDRKIQNLIKKSIVFPDLTEKSQPYQYKTASEMMIDVEDTYNDLSGCASITDVLCHLSREIKNPSKIIIGDKGENKRIAKYSQTEMIRSGLEKKSSIKILPLISILFIAVTMCALYLFFIKNGPNNIPPPQKVPLQPDTTASLPNEPIVKSVEVTEIIKDKKPVKKTAVKPKIEKPAKNSLQLDYEIILKLIRNRKMNDAYKEVKRLLNTSNDAALLIIKADLIKRRNPQSPAIPILLEQAKNQKSRLMSKQELQKKILMLTK